MAKQAPRLLHWIALIAILGLSGYLRLTNLATNPGWYSDEGSNLDVATHLAQGHIQYMILQDSTLLVSRMPVFEGLLALALKFASGFVAIRTLTGLLGVITVGMVYFALRGIENPRFALTASLLLGIYPQAVLSNRFGFSYNLLAVLVVIVFAGLLRYSCTEKAKQKYWLAVTMIAIGIGIVSDLWMLGFLIPVLVVVCLHRPRDVVWSLPLAFLPFGCYALFMLIRAPDSFLFDLRFVFFRVSNAGLATQFYNVMQNYTTLLSQDFWLPGAIIGLLVLRSKRTQSLILILFLLTILVIGRTVALYSLSFYYMIPLLPFIAMGMAALIIEGLPFLWQQLTDYLSGYLMARRIPHFERLSRLGTLGVIILLVFVPFGVSLSLELTHVREGFPTAIDPFLVNGNDAQAAIQVVNAHTTPDDLVIASSVYSWALQAHTADFQMVIEAQGQATVHLPAGIPPTRWIVPPQLARARLVIIDNLWTSWGVVNIPGLSTMMQDIEKWPLLFESGSIRVYQNPDSVNHPD